LISNTACPALIEAERFARPEAVGHFWPARPERSGRRPRQRQDI
jgi:hypothetical protein